MKTNFKKFMGTEAPKCAKPLPPSKVNEARDHAWSTHLMGLYKRDMFSKDDVIRALLRELKEDGGDVFGSIADVIRVFRREGLDWPEFKAIEKSLVKEGATPDETITITLGVKGDAKKKLAQLLHSISNTCAMGCSRTWGILNGDRGEGAKVDFDGDGADQLIDVKIDGQPVKDLF